MRVKFIKAIYADDNMDSIVRRNFLSIINEKGIIREEDLKGFHENGNAYILLEFKPFDPEKPAERMAAVSKKIKGKIVTIKTRYGNVFKFKLID